MWIAEGDIPKEVRPRPDIDDWQQKGKNQEKSKVQELFAFSDFSICIVVTSKQKTS